MRIIIEFETTNLKFIKEHSSYNHLCHEVIGTRHFNFTHIFEIYDDVNDEPIYEFVELTDDGFSVIGCGEGNAIPEGKESCGGIFVKIELYGASGMFK